MSRTERAARIAEASGAGALVRRLRRSGPPVVLAYHRIGDGSASPYDRAAWDATAEQLDAQLAFLAASFDVVAPGELLRPSRRRRVLITFDDGYRDNHDIALGLLRRHGLTAAFFVTTGFLDDRRPAWWDELAWIARTSERPALELHGERYPLDGAALEDSIRRLLARYKTLDGSATAEFLDAAGEAAGTGRHPAEAAGVWMTWDMVRGLRDAGMTVGGHSATHPILARLDAAAQRREISACAARLEAELGEPMRFFSYPVGLRDAFDAHTRAALREQGVELAFSLYGAHRGAWDPYDVRRCSVGGAGRERFRMICTAPELFGRS